MLFCASRGIAKSVGKVDLQCIHLRLLSSTKREMPGSVQNKNAASTICGLAPFLDMRSRSLPVHLVVATPELLANKFIQIDAGFMFSKYSR